MNKTPIILTSVGRNSTDMTIIQVSYREGIKILSEGLIHSEGLIYENTASKIATLKYIIELQIKMIMQDHCQ